MQALVASGDIRSFRRTSGEEITGRVLGLGNAVVATGVTSAARVWILEDENGAHHHVWHGEWELT